jgi:LPS export ABC transporter protein LptC
MLLLFALLVAVFVKYRQFSENPAKIVEALPEGADIAIDDVRHEAVEDGRKAWSLEAASASYNDSAKTITFETVAVIIFREDGREVMVKGRHGRLDTETNDIEISGAVVVKDADYELTTERLFYDQARRRIRVPVPLSIAGPSLDLQADQMSIDLESEIALLKGSVKGVFSGNQALPF